MEQAHEVQPGVSELHLPCSLRDIYLVAEVETTTLYCRHLDSMEKSGRDAEVDAYVRARGARAAKQLEGLAEMVARSTMGDQAGLRLRWFGDLDIISTSPGEVLRRHANVRIAARSAAVANLVAAWSVAGSGTSSTRVQIQRTVQQLAARVEELQQDLRRRGQQLHAAHPWLRKHRVDLELVELAGDDRAAWKVVYRPRDEGVPE